MLYAHHGTVQAPLCHSKLKKPTYLRHAELSTEGKEQGKNHELDFEASPQMWHIYLQSHATAQNKSDDYIK